MKTFLRPVCNLLLLACLVVSAFAADDNPETGPTSGAQAAADAIREYAKTDGAFIAGGQVKAKFDESNLATILQYPSEEIVVVELTGSDIRQAFERSISIYPKENSSFLQISGFEVSFSKTEPTGKRILSVTAGGMKLDDSKKYSVAMPLTLGRGGFGYFKLWDKAKIKKTLENATLESILKGKRATDSSPRWVASS